MISRAFLFSFLALSLPLFSSATTLSDLESKIAALLSQIQTLQTELQTLKSTEELEMPQASVASSFTTTLGKGSEGREVTALQRYLAKDPALYPEGLVSGYYGALTEAAVKRFQAKHNIVSAGTPATTGYGVLGPKTRAILNALLATTPIDGTTPTPTPTPIPLYTPNTPNRSPNLSVSGDRIVFLPNSASLSAIATDDGKPSNTLTYLWSKASGPGIVTFSSLTTKDTTATFSSAGTYQISATVSDGDLFASYTVALIVSAPSATATTTAPATTIPSPTLTLSVNPTSVSSGSQSTLTWSTTNTTSCTASGGWSGTKATSGASAVTPGQTTTYTLACTGAGGSATKSITVSVTTTPPPPPENGGVLRVHPTNPRYFTDDSGKAIYMTGSHIWYTIQAGPEEFAPLNPSMSDAEFSAYLDWMQSHGQNFTRMWSALSYMDYGGPFPWNRPGPGTANDGKSKFNMTSFNQQYFDLLRRRVLQIQERGMYASVMFFGSHNGFKSDFPYVAWHPDNNINSELASAFSPNDGYSFFTTNSAALEIERALVRKTINTLNDIDNIIWETMNEPGGTARAVAWNKAMVQYVHSYEATQPKQHLVGMTGGWGLGEAMLGSDADWISPDWDDEYKEGGSASYSSKIAIVDTDHLSPWYLLDVQEVTNMRKWVWKTFTRGNHPIFMDVYNIHNPEYNAYGSIDPAFDPVRDAMGDTRSYSLRFPSLARMIPSETLSDTGYALYENGVAYLVYQSDHSSFVVNLSAGNYTAEWFDPRDGSKSTATINHNGGDRSFTLPSHISDDAVLYLLAQ